MSTGGVGGPRPAQYDLPLDDTGSEAEPETDAGQVSRSTDSGAALGVWQSLQQDTAANLLAADLGEAAIPPAGSDGDEIQGVLDELGAVDDEVLGLEDELLELGEELETGSLDALSTSEIEERIAWIKEELEFLYAYESLLIEELEDPALGTLDSFWVEWDLWDVEFDIDDLEAELADLQGEVYERQAESLWGDFMGGFAKSMDSFLNYFDSAYELDNQALVEDRHQDARQLLVEMAQQRIDNAQQQQKLDLEKARQALQQDSRPQLTDEVREQLVGVRPEVQALIEDPSKENLDRVRERISEIRGPRAHH